jgi:hypothetical protein
MAEHKQAHNNFDHKEYQSIKIFQLNFINIIHIILFEVSEYLLKEFNKKKLLKEEKHS